MQRRSFLGCAVAVVASGGTAYGQVKDEFTRILEQVANDPQLVKATWPFREKDVSRGVGHGEPSRRELNAAAFTLIRNFEVSSPTVYDSLYRHPIWPEGVSGVTFGIGYDLGYATRDELDRDWPKLSLADRDLLATVLGIRGQPAGAAKQKVASVDVPYRLAEEQFRAFLPYPTKQTEIAFPNCEKLSDDSFGALVSLVYNRGPAHERNSTKRVEMYQIFQAMSSGQRVQIEKIPSYILAMRQQWPNVRGLQLRRQAEAALFARGLTQNS